MALNKLSSFNFPDEDGTMYSDWIIQDHNAPVEKVVICRAASQTNVDFNSDFPVIEYRTVYNVIVYASKQIIRYEYYLFTDDGVDDRTKFLELKMRNKYVPGFIIRQGIETKNRYMLIIDIFFDNSHPARYMSAPFKLGTGNSRGTG